MTWYTISTSEIAAGQPIDAEMIKKIQSNANNAIAVLNIRTALPNGSFEYATGTIPKAWEVTTHTGGSASLSTGCHGRYSMSFTHPGGNGNGGGIAISEYLPFGGSIYTSFYGWIWASSTSVRGHLKVYTYDKDFMQIGSTSMYDGSSFTATPATYTYGFTSPSNAKWIRIEIGCGTVSTVAGSIYFDELYLYPG